MRVWSILLLVLARMASANAQQNVVGPFEVWDGAELNAAIIDPANEVQGDEELNTETNDHI